MEKVQTTVEDLKRVAVDGLQALFSYALAVGNDVGKKKALCMLLEARSKTYSDAQIKWAKENMARLGIHGKDAIAAHELTEAYFNDTKMYTFGNLMAEQTNEQGYGVFVEKGPKRVVIRHRLWCPLLEACNNLRVEPRFFCEHFAFPEWERVVKATVNPRFALRANKIRPEADYCEEVYEIQE